MKLTKYQISLFVLWLVEAIVLILFSMLEDMDLLINKLVVFAGVILEMVTVISMYYVGNKNRKKAIQEFIPLRNVHIQEANEKYLDKKVAKTSAQKEVTLIHIDSVEENKVNIRLYKDKVLPLDVVRIVNKD